MGDPEALGREPDKSHHPLPGWFQILFRVSVRTALVLLLVFCFLPRVPDIFDALTDPPLYNSDGTGVIVEHYAQTEVLADYRPEHAVCYLEHYTFTAERVLVTPWAHSLTGEPALRVSILLKAVHPNPSLRCPRISSWLWAEDDLGNVLARTETEDTVIYLLQDGDSYALCGLTRRNGPLWSAGGLSSVVRDQAYPMTVLPTAQYLLVIVNDPDIAEVEVLCYDRFGGGFQTLKLPQATIGDCYLFQYPDQQTPYKFSSGNFLLRGYDKAGAPVFQSAVPEHWTAQWDLTIPEAR